MAPRRTSGVNPPAPARSAAPRAVAYHCGENDGADDRSWSPWHPPSEAGTGDTGAAGCARGTVQWLTVRAPMNPRRPGRAMTTPAQGVRSCTTGQLAGCSGARATSTSERTGPVNARQHVAQLRQCVAPGEPPPPPAAPPSDDNSSNFPPPLWRASSATTTRPPAASSRTPAERGATRLEITHEHQQVGSLGQPTKVADYDGQMTTPSRTTSGSTWRDS